MKFRFDVILILIFFAPINSVTITSDTGMTIFSSEKIIDAGFHTRTYARWEFGVNDSKFIISGYTYISRTDSFFTNKLSEWRTPLDISIIHLFKKALLKGLEWDTVAKSNNVENYSKEIDSLGYNFNIIFKVDNNKSYIHVIRNEWPYPLILECVDNYDFIKNAQQLISAIDSFPDKYEKYRSQKALAVREKQKGINTIQEEKKSVDALFE